MECVVPGSSLAAGMADTPTVVAVSAPVVQHKAHSMMAPMLFGVLLLSLVALTLFAVTGPTDGVLDDCAPTAAPYDDDAVASRDQSRNATLPGASTLLIIQGGIRTFDLCVDSILDHLCRNNGGCRIVLSLSSSPLGLSEATRRKLAPYLIGEIYRETTDVMYPWYIFE